MNTRSGWAESPKELAELVYIAFLSLPGPSEFKAVAGGQYGLIDGMRPGSVIFDLSTNSPTVVRDLHSKFSDKGFYVLDAPVSGGPAGAHSGKLALWVGGDEQIFKKYKPVLDSMGDQVAYIGPIGAGSVAKLVQNRALITL